MTKKIYFSIFLVTRCKISLTYLPCACYTSYWLSELGFTSQSGILNLHRDITSLGEMAEFFCFCNAFRAMCKEVSLFWCFISLNAKCLTKNSHYLFLCLGQTPVKVQTHNLPYIEWSLYNLICLFLINLKIYYKKLDTERQFPYVVQLLVFKIIIIILNLNVKCNHMYIKSLVHIYIH